MVATKYVITAAHCFIDEDEHGIITYVHKASEIDVEIGEDNIILDDKEEDKPLPTIRRKVRKLTFHKNHTTKVGEKSTGHSDLAILMLSSEVDIEKYTPACLARKIDELSFYNKKAWVAGWGVYEQPIVDIDGNTKSLPHHFPDQVHEARIRVRKCLHGHPSLLCGQHERKSTCLVR